MKPKFDFEIGYLVKSPCRNCSQRALFPACIDDCRLIAGIHTLLAHGVASVRRYSALETYAIAQPNWKRE